MVSLTDHGQVAYVARRAIDRTLDMNADGTGQKQLPPRRYEEHKWFPDALQCVFDYFSVTAVTNLGMEIGGGKT